MSKIVSTIPLLGTMFLALAGCRAQPPALGPDDAQTMRHAAQDPQTLGELVYRGTVFDRSTADGPLFRYERRVHDGPAGTTSTHLTLDPSGEPVVVQRAEHRDGYVLERFESLQRQIGSRASVEIAEDGGVSFSLTRGGSTKVRTERAGTPVVVGPTLFGTVAHAWDALLRGDAKQVRFADVERARTFPFTIRFESQTPETTAFSMVASSALVRAVVPRMVMVFDNDTRRILRYEGLVPPLRRHRGRLEPLDARVEYESVAERYR
ncbi:MAG: hypothetical protein AAF721_05895 [Myxococcota bacterium]